MKLANQLIEDRYGPSKITPEVMLQAIELANQKKAAQKTKSEDIKG